MELNESEETGLSAKRLDTIVAAVSEKLNVPVHVVEDGPVAAWYDGKAVRIARLKIKSLIPPGSSNRSAKAVVYTSAAKAFMSDTGISETLSQKLLHYPGVVENDIQKTTLSSLFNVLEDIRVESRLTEKFEGVKQEIKEFAEQTRKNHFDRLVQNQDLEQLSEGMYLNTQYPDIPTDCHKEAKSIIENLTPIADKAKSATNSTEILELAIQALTKIQHLLENPPSSCPSEGSEEKEQESDDSEQNAGEGEKESKSLEPEEKEGDQDKKAKKTSSKEPKVINEKVKVKIDPGKKDSNFNDPTKKLNKNICKTTKERPSNPDKIRDATKEIIKTGKAHFNTFNQQASKPFALSATALYPKELRFSAEGGEIYKVASTQNDLIKKSPFVSLPNFIDCKQEINGRITVLKRKLKDIFTLSKKNKFIPGFTSGRFIDTSAFHRVLCDDDRLFMKRDKENKRDVAITLVIDHSGSMGASAGSKMKLVIESTILFAETLESIGIPYEILGFTTEGEIPGAGMFDSNTRLDQLLHLVIKEFDEKYNDAVKGRIGGMTGYGNNLDAEALLWAYSRIKQRPEKDKIIIMLSDGQPAGAVHHQNNKNLLKKSVRAVEDKGLVVIGLGYAHGGVQEFYPNNLVVTDTSKLPEQFIKLLKKCLF